MARRAIVSATSNNLKDLPKTCGSCGYWEEVEPIALGGCFPNGQEAKKTWYSTVQDGWGSCGKIVMQDDQTLAYCQFAPAGYLPRLNHYNLGPVSEDAVFLACLYIPEPFRGRGLGKLLVNAVQKDMIKRGYRAIETFARRAPARNPSGWLEFYQANGWKVMKESGSITQLRSDLRATVTWQENLEAVLNGISLPTVKVPIPTDPEPG